MTHFVKLTCAESNHAVVVNFEAVTMIRPEGDKTRICFGREGEVDVCETLREVMEHARCANQP
jgi:hypothetical protein